MNSNPYLSIVIPSRNDNFRGESLKRLEFCINNLIAQAKKYDLKLELIIVEWSPPKDKPLLKDVLLLPDDLGPVIIRFIIVPEEIHKRYNASSKINMIKGPDFNVGIRRATGEFILGTNADILFDDEIVKFLSSRKLDKDNFYRANRYDVKNEVMELESSLDIQNFCRNSINIIYDNPNVDRSVFFLRKKLPPLHTGAGDFILLSKENYCRLHGWPELNHLGLCTDPLLCYMAYFSGQKEIVLDGFLRVYHIAHKYTVRKSPGKFHLFLIFKFRNNKKIMLLLRNLRYHFNKYKYIFLDCVAKNRPEKDLEFNRFIVEYNNLLYEMFLNKRSYIFNGENWGLPNEFFQEISFGPGKIKS